MVQFQFPFRPVPGPALLRESPERNAEKQGFCSAICSGGNANNFSTIELSCSGHLFRGELKLSRSGGGNNLSIAITNCMLLSSQLCGIGAPREGTFRSETHLCIDIVCTTYMLLPSGGLCLKHTHTPYMEKEYDHCRA
jgi:hypothetical protein